MKVGLCNGCFDLFHDGHRHFLRHAARACDYLVVAVNNDRSVRELKGEDRPFRGLGRRIADVRGFVETLTDSAVIPFDGSTSPLLAALAPGVWIKGAEYSDRPGFRYFAVPALYMGPNARLSAVQVHGARDVVPIVYVDRIPGISTSLIARELGYDRRTGDGPKEG